MTTDDSIPTADSAYLETDDRTIHYLQAGKEGPPVVLLHGSGIDDAGLSWKPTIPALADSYRVFAPDWPGHGDSDDPDAPPSGSYYESVLESFLEGLGLEEVILVGISMGGGAALGHTLDDPDRVRSLVLIDSYGLRDAIPGGIGAYILANTPLAGAIGRQWASASRSTARASLGQFVHDTDAVSEEFVAEVRQRLKQPGAGNAFMAFQRNEFGPRGVQTHYTDELDQLAAPTLLVHGRQDPLIPVSWSVDAAESIPDSNLQVLDHCGHWPTRERPDAFIDHLRSFLDDHRRSASD
jgi:pimeloyl-ACP methyl ester carboxylesterase